MSVMASWNWTCPYCGQRSQHTLDCQRNSPENRKMREAFGQCGHEGTAIEPEQPESEDGERG